MSKIKEVEITSNYIMMKYNPNYYTDKMVISEHAISYERKNYFSSETVRKWGYKTDSDKYNEAYTNLICSIQDDLDLSSPMDIPDSGTFKIVLKYDDGTLKEYEFTSDFQSNKLNHLAYLINRCIPNDEIKSDFLQKENTSDYDKDNLDRLIGFFKKHKKVKWDGKKNDTGDIIFITNPNYPPEVEDLLRLTETDYQYMENIEKIKKYNIHPEFYDLEMIKAYITWLKKTERFVDGNIASEIENGNVLKVLLRLKQLNDNKVTEN